MKTWVKILLILGCCLLGVALIAGLVSLLLNKWTKAITTAPKIFVELNELEFLDDYQAVSIPDDTRAVKDLTIVDRKCVQVNYKGGEFKLYAYVFSTTQEAVEFDARVTRISKERDNGYFYMTHQKERAIFVDGSLRSSEKFMDLLYEHLSSTVNLGEYWQDFRDRQ